MCIEKKSLVFYMSFMCLLSINIYAEEIHKVQKGETIYQLSKQYGIPVEILLSANDIIDPSAIPTGETLQIPDGDTKKYKVKKGDTLYSIAHMYGITLYELREYNKTISDNIKVGQLINIPLSSEMENDTNISSDTAVTVASTSNAADVSQEISNNIIEKKAILQNTQDSKINNSFVTIYNDDMLKNSKLIGQLSEKWPISGQAYLLQGKLPGIIIEGKENQIVHASSDGIVIYAALHTSFSHVVIIQSDDGLVYVYAGQKKLYVKQGDTVVKGSELGILGIMPTLQKSLLYFSLWDKNISIDPRSRLG